MNTLNEAITLQTEERTERRARSSFLFTLFGYEHAI